MTKLIIQRQQQKAKYYTKKLGEGISLDMMLIPGGSFQMGTPAQEIEKLCKEYDTDYFQRESPQHPVNISSFFMGRYPITQAQWRAIATLDPIERELKPEPSRFKGDNRPVEQVSWYDAIEFCARLSRHTGRDYRLPSEAEWEYACRAGTTTAFHFGETISTDLANYNGADEKYGAYGRGLRGEYRQQTTDVDYFKVANAFGLSDMHGNVWEWCLEPWHDNYKGAPRDGQVWDEENKNDNHYQNSLSSINVLLKDERIRVIRGGSWYPYPGYCRSASRGDSNPRGLVDNAIGFRVVRAVPRTP
jgi:formylglycine-generating enzyme required for sulfatase activity